MKNMPNNLLHTKAILYTITGKKAKEILLNSRNVTIDVRYCW